MVIKAVEVCDINGDDVNKPIGSYFTYMIFNEEELEKIYGKLAKKAEEVE